MPVWFYSACCGSAGAVATAPLNISRHSDFYAPANDFSVSIHFTNQNTMPLPSHVKASAPHILSSFFCLINQQMPPQFCPISFTLFLLIKRGGKTYSILMHIRENSDTSSGGIDHSQPPLPNHVPMTSIIRPHSCWLMHSRQVPLSSAPTPITTLFHHRTAFLSPFLFPPSFALSPICLPHLPSHSHSPSFPPLLFLHISSLYSFRPVIRSWRPPADVNRGASQPGVSG